MTLLTIFDDDASSCEQLLQSIDLEVGGAPVPLPPHASCDRLPPKARPDQTRRSMSINYVNRILSDYIPQIHSSFFLLFVEFKFVFIRRRPSFPSTRAYLNILGGWRCIVICRCRGGIATRAIITDRRLIVAV